MLDLDALERLAQAATPCKRFVTRYDHGGGRLTDAATRHVLIADTYGAGDREFIAACSPDTVLALIQRCREAEQRQDVGLLTQRLDRALDALRQIDGMHQTCDAGEACAMQRVASHVLGLGKGAVPPVTPTQETPLEQQEQQP